MTTVAAPAQLVFDLGHRTALGRDDFLVSQCNADAVAWIDRWRGWLAPGLVICGPAASGKSHLGQVWRAQADAPMITPADLLERDPPDLVGEGARVYFDRADAVAGDAAREEAALHVYNLVAEEGGQILFSARTPPARWPLQLADLRSRLRALPVVTIAPPDDEILAAVLVKLFADRQVEVSVGVVQFAVSHMERSFEAAEILVDALDNAALAARRPVTVRLVREVIRSLAAGEATD